MFKITFILIISILAFSYETNDKFCKVRRTKCDDFKNKKGRFSSCREFRCNEKYGYQCTDIRKIIKIIFIYLDIIIFNNLSFNLNAKTKSKYFS